MALARPGPILAEHAQYSHRATPQMCRKKLSGCPRASDEATQPPETMMPFAEVASTLTGRQILQP